MRRQALGGTADNNRDSTSGTLTEDVGAGLFGNATEPEVEKKITVQGDLEVRR